ncbi:malonyl-CoA O-methyltransferase [Moraxella cuniculi DSM 21768]|uniref:Malonyl-CoA O-methyltransferase n=1 Tax=Moraxella cuniculi DSM 21768 TaxID=1122245 RepID=A0A1N7FB77_9GAMM|nr:methyltransferase domain-containing protein [Moraxella cuniculi]SIR97475.1 malonyl-CoA O-methyltransferase [Moraxella cuniculi DSM 21768]
MQPHDTHADHAMTMPTDNKIAKRFAKAHHSYRSHAVVQRLMVQRLMAGLLAYLPAGVLPQVLEIGVGSGLLTDALLERYQVQQLYLNDLYEHIMENPLANQPSQCQYLLGDICHIDVPQGLNLVVSSAMLQWVYPLDGLLVKLYHAMATGGYFAMSSFVQGNLEQIYQLTGQGLAYDTPKQLLARLTMAGFVIDKVEVSDEVVYFDSPMAVLRHLQATGVTATSGSFRWNKQRLDEFCQRYWQLADAKGVPLTYRPIIIIAHKKTNKTP